jgi:transcriptional regulator with XRE-family HTH domain
MKKSKGKETYEKNWTESDIGNFLYYVGADFVDQLQASFDTLGITQRSFAQKLNVSEGRISQVFNDPGNLTLDTMIKWGRAAGLKTGVILYNDGDVKNVRGPLSGSIFIECWKR